MTEIGSCSLLIVGAPVGRRTWTRVRYGGDGRRQTTIMLFVVGEDGVCRGVIEGRQAGNRTKIERVLGIKIIQFGTVVRKTSSSATTACKAPVVALSVRSGIARRSLSC